MCSRQKNRELDGWNGTVWDGNEVEVITSSKCEQGHVL